MENIKKKILLITGAVTSGKAALACLLEGHPEAFAMPFWHDKVASGLTNFHFPGPTRLLGYPAAKIWSIMNALTNDTDINVLKLFSLQQKFVYPASAGEIIEFPTNFNYYDLEVNIYNDLTKLETENINADNITSIMFKNLQNIFSPKTIDTCKYYVSQSTNGFIRYEDFFKAYSGGGGGSKIIYVKRDIVDWLFTMAWRSSRCSHEKMMGSINWVFENDPRIKNLIYLDKNIENLQSKYPQNLKIIKFEDLILRHEIVIKEVCGFLQIEEHKNMFVPTILGTEIPLVKEIKDDISKIITSEEDKHIRNWLRKYKSRRSVAARIKRFIRKR
ncbi:MAG: hypothetical protein LBI57_00165 [Helicobacteraceae bacterium]|jgi:hypothetical protein|nr:hypothetical protein [Helicobacteraceae bacterium]